MVIKINGYLDSNTEVQQTFCEMKPLEIDKIAWKKGPPTSFSTFSSRMKWEKKEMSNDKHMIFLKCSCKKTVDYEF